MTTIPQPQGAVPSRWRQVAATAAFLLVLVVVAYLVAIPLGLVPTENRLSIGELALLAVVLVGCFVALQGYSVKDVSIGQSGITAKLERLSRRQGAVESDVGALRVAVTALVTKYEEQHLQGLAGRRPAMVLFSDKMISELERLDSINYVAPVGGNARGINAIREDHGRDGTGNFDLKSYLEITPEGLQYLALRQRLSDGTG